jgi:hypothetical protein
MEKSNDTCMCPAHVEIVASAFLLLLEVEAAKAFASLAFSKTWDSSLPLSFP